MSYQEKLSKVKDLFEEHNSLLKSGTDKPSFPEKGLNFQNFKEALILQGVSGEEDLSKLRYEDIASCLPDLPTGDKPMFLAKKIAKIFRGKDQGVSSEEAEKMSLRELTVRYDPKSPHNPVGERLQKISNGKPFLVFNEDSSVTVEKSLELLKELKEGYPAVEKVTVDGEPRRPYKVGDGPDRYASENPLYPGRPLRPHGEACDQTGRSWEGIDRKVRQFIRLVVKEEDELSIDRAHDLIDEAMAKEALSNLKQKYQDVALGFQEKKEKDDLPNLRVKLNGEDSSGGFHTTVFEGGKKVK